MDPTALALLLPQNPLYSDDLPLPWMLCLLLQYLIRPPEDPWTVTHRWPTPPKYAKSGQGVTSRNTD
jgi:hypothetical protein